MVVIYGSQSLVYWKIEVLEHWGRAQNHSASYSQIPLMSYSPGEQEASVPEALILVQERLLVTGEGGCSAGKRIGVFP